jgi:hypothetical protein
MYAYLFFEMHFWFTNRNLSNSGSYIGVLKIIFFGRTNIENGT